VPEHQGSVIIKRTKEISRCSLMAAEGGNRTNERTPLTTIASSIVNRACHHLLCPHYPRPSRPRDKAAKAGSKETASLSDQLAVLGAAVSHSIRSNGIIGAELPRGA
jgi:hypothetical protein